MGRHRERSRHVSAQPNRKQQRLAREISKSEGVPYQTALTKIRETASHRAFHR